MKIPPVKGTRDFYPPEMAIHNFLIEGWKGASLRSGFEEYDGPIFEYLKMYQVKSGEEIAEQLFNLTDRGGRELAIRPEITPTLARMVNQQINALPRPIKWFSVPRLCRAERPQRGRLREFYQWNIDIIGVEDVLADAEVIFTTVDYLRSVGLGPSDIKVKISSRKLLHAFLVHVGIGEEKMDHLYALLDKKAKLPEEAFAELLAEQVADADAARRIRDFMEVDGVGDIAGMFDSDGEVARAVGEVEELFELLGLMGVGDYCVFDPGIVRGLAYYTGIVFEVHDVVGDLRAIAGGGRYDNLLKQFGGPAVTGTGMGMGDAVLEILLRDRGLLDEVSQGVKSDYFVACADKDLQNKAIEIAAKMRSGGYTVNFSYKATGLGKQLKQASSLNAAKCVIVGEEFASGQLAIKDMVSGEQELVDADEFLSQFKV